MTASIEHNDSLSSTKAINDSLCNLVNAVALDWGLKYDSLGSVAGKKLGFWGSEYHYYTFEISDSNGTRFINISFAHDARLSSDEYSHSEPEHALSDTLKKVFGSRVWQLEIKRTRTHRLEK